MDALAGQVPQLFVLILGTGYAHIQAQFRHGIDGRIGELRSSSQAHALNVHSDDLSALCEGKFVDELNLIELSFSGQA
ncbi:MAG: hypothetical protein AB7O99_09415 [Dongiaceae bacterium]